MATRFDRRYNMPHSSAIWLKVFVEEVQEHSQCCTQLAAGNYGEYDTAAIECMRRGLAELSNLTSRIELVTSKAAKFEDGRELEVHCKEARLQLLALARHVSSSQRAVSAQAFALSLGVAMEGEHDEDDALQAQRQQAAAQQLDTELMRLARLSLVADVPSPGPQGNTGAGALLKAAAGYAPASKSPPGAFLHPRTLTAQFDSASKARDGRQSESGDDLATQQDVDRHLSSALGAVGSLHRLAPEGSADGSNAAASFALPGWMRVNAPSTAYDANSSDSSSGPPTPAAASTSSSLRHLPHPPLPRASGNRTSANRASSNRASGTRASQSQPATLATTRNSAAGAAADGSFASKVVSMLAQRDSQTRISAGRYSATTGSVSSSATNSPGEQETRGKARDEANLRSAAATPPPTISAFNTRITLAGANASPAGMSRYGDAGAAWQRGCAQSPLLAARAGAAAAGAAAAGFDPREAIAAHEAGQEWEASAVAYSTPPVMYSRESPLLPGQLQAQGSPPGWMAQPCQPLMQAAEPTRHFNIFRRAATCLGTNAKGQGQHAFFHWQEDQQAAQLSPYEADEEGPEQEDTWQRSNADSYDGDVQGKGSFATGQLLQLHDDDQQEETTCTDAMEVNQQQPCVATETFRKGMRGSIDDGSLCNMMSAISMSNIGNRSFTAGVQPYPHLALPICSLNSTAATAHHAAAAEPQDDADEATSRLWLHSPGMRQGASEGVPPCRLQSAWQAEAPLGQQPASAVLAQTMILPKAQGSGASTYGAGLATSGVIAGGAAAGSGLEHASAASSSGISFTPLPANPDLPAVRARMQALGHQRTLANPAQAAAAMGSAPAPARTPVRPIAARPDSTPTSNHADFLTPSKTMAKATGTALQALADGPTSQSLTYSAAAVMQAALRCSPLQGRAQSGKAEAVKGADSKGQGSIATADASSSNKAGASSLILCSVPQISQADAASLPGHEGCASSSMMAEPSEPVTAMAAPCMSLQLLEQMQPRSSCSNQPLLGGEVQQLHQQRLSARQIALLAAGINDSPLPSTPGLQAAVSLEVLLPPPVSAALSALSALTHGPDEVDKAPCSNVSMPSESQAECSTQAAEDSSSRLDDVDVLLQTGGDGDSHCGGVSLQTSVSSTHGMMMPVREQSVLTTQELLGTRALQGSVSQARPAARGAGTRPQERPQAQPQRLQDRAKGGKQQGTGRGAAPACAAALALQPALHRPLEVVDTSKEAAVAKAAETLAASGGSTASLCSAASEQQHRRRSRGAGMLQWMAGAAKAAAGAAGSVLLAGAFVAAAAAANTGLGEVSSMHSSAPARQTIIADADADAEHTAPYPSSISSRRPGASKPDGVLPKRTVQQLRSADLLAMTRG